MKTTTKRAAKSPWKPWRGFAIEIGPDTDLGGDAMLILEVGGNYRPIAGVSTINEARELAANHHARRPTTGIYKVWARGVDGEFLVVPTVIL